MIKLIVGTKGSGKTKPSSTWQKQQLKHPKAM